MPYAYILECNDGTFYTGSTWDLERRLGQHQAGVAVPYTRKRRPVRLVWCHDDSSIRTVFEIEHQVKKWSQAKKRALIEGRQEDLPALARSRGPADGAPRQARGRS